VRIDALVAPGAMLVELAPLRLRKDVAARANKSKRRR